MIRLIVKISMSSIKLVMVYQCRFHDFDTEDLEVKRSHIRCVPYSQVVLKIFTHTHAHMHTDKEEMKTDK